MALFCVDMQQRDRQTGYMGEPKAEPEFARETLEKNKFVSNIERRGNEFYFDLEDIPLDHLQDLCADVSLDAGYAIEDLNGQKKKAYPVQPVR